MAASALPGLTVEVVRPAAQESPLRTDVAGVIGRTRRGPAGLPVRADGWRDLVTSFGGLDTRYVTGYALRGYIENGGQVVHVIRLDGAGAKLASRPWVIGDITGAGFTHASYRIEASSPGEWANDTQVTISYAASGLFRPHELSVRVEVPGEAPESFAGIAPQDVAGQLASSRFIRLRPGEDAVTAAAGAGGAAGPPAPGGAAPAPGGPGAKTWQLILDGGADPVPGVDDYLRAAQQLGEIGEVALVFAADLHADLGPDALAVLRVLLGDAVDRQDRLVFVDVPAAQADPAPAAAWTQDLRQQLDPQLLRAAAVYHPWLRVTDPLGGTRNPLRDVPPSGHVAGLASRLDRQRGAQHTPANALLADAVDLTTPLSRDQQAIVAAGGLNLLRCRPGHGLEVWGGRTLDPDPARRFVAHRRLLHRLVRAIRRVAEPLVFEPSGPVLRFALVRGVSSVLLEAWRAGGLKGATPEQGFRVRCDDGNNPPDLTDLGQLECEVLLAPAAPMEYIRILLTIAPEGQLEVVEG
jgi:uncharacterized protein